MNGAEPMVLERRPATTPPRDSGALFLPAWERLDDAALLADPAMPLY